MLGQKWRVVWLHRIPQRSVPYLRWTQHLLGSQAESFPKMRYLRRSGWQRDVDEVRSRPTERLWTLTVAVGKAKPLFGVCSHHVPHGMVSDRRFAVVWRRHRTCGSADPAASWPGCTDLSIRHDDAS